VLGTWFQKFSQFLDLLFPPRCVHCHAANSWLCQTCFKDIPFIVTEVCGRCGTPISVDVSLLCQQCLNNPLTYIDGVRVASYYEDNPIRSAIHALKYRNHKGLVTCLGEILAQAYRQQHLEADVVVPVPLHRSKLKERGYNQSELLAKEVCRLLKLPINTVTLQRFRKTKSQMTLGTGERHKNVAHAFLCNDKQLQNQRVLLIDDVCTTGSTLDFCAAALKESNVISVWGLTLAKAH
jgi:ComF family protein